MIKLPRFIVTELTAYNSGGHLTTHYHVIDRAFCHRLVRTFTNVQTWSGRFKADTLARKLNHDWEKQQWPNQ